MRVGIDVAPLVQTRAGTARHVRGLVGALRDRPGLELELLTFGGPGRVSSVVRDALWYPRGLRRAARGLDVLHCTTFRGPRRASTPTVLTVHDLAILRSPEAFPRWHRLYGRAGLTKVLRAADAVVAVSELTRDEVVSLADVPAERIRVIPNGVDGVFTAEGPSADGDVRARRRDARAAEEPRRGPSTPHERPASSCGWSVLAGGEASTSPAGSARCPTRRSPSSTAAPGQCSTRLCTRASGCPSSRRWPAGRRSSRRAGRPWRRSPAVQPSSSTRSTSSRSRPALAEAERRRDELVPLGLERARSFTWDAAADAVEALWRELA